LDVEVIRKFAINEEYEAYVVMIAVVLEINVFRQTIISITGWDCVREEACLTTGFIRKRLSY